MAVAGLGTAQEMGASCPPSSRWSPSTTRPVRGGPAVAHGPGQGRSGVRRTRQPRRSSTLVEGEAIPGNVDEMPRLISRGSTAALVASATGDGQDALPAQLRSPTRFTSRKRENRSEAFLKS